MLIDILFYVFFWYTNSLSCSQDKHLWPESLDCDKQRKGEDDKDKLTYIHQK